MNSVTAALPTTLEEQERAILTARFPDDPQLISQYIKSATEPFNGDVRLQRQQCYRVARTLLDCVCDTYLPDHWRQGCLDQICLPLQRLQTLALSACEQQKLKSFYAEMQILVRYFCR